MINLFNHYMFFIFQQMVFVIMKILQHLNLIQIMQLLNLPQIMIDLELEFSWPMY